MSKETPAGSTEDRTTKRSVGLHTISAGILCLLCIAAYSNTLHAPFVFDDDPNIRDNAFIRVTELDADRLYDAAFRSPMRRRPVANLSLALNYYFGRYDVTGYHAVNIAIHCVNAILVYLLGLHLFGRLAGNTRRAGPTIGVAGTAFLAAAVFALHPVQTQSVTYIVQRMNSMAAMFYLSALLVYIGGRERQGRARWLLWNAGALSWALALGSKEIAATLPAAIFLYEWYVFRDLSTVWLKRIAPYLVGTAILGGVLLLSLFGTAPMDFSGRDFTMWERLLTQFRVIVFYISLLVYPLPNRLNLTHEFPISTSLVDPFSTLVCLVILLAVFGVGVHLSRRQRLLSFCVLWFFLHLLIESSIVHLELVFEHRLYLPMVGFAVFVAYTVVTWLPARAAAAVAVVTVAALGMATYQRNSVWGDLFTLWSDVVAKSPNDARAHMSLGSVLEERGQLDEAGRHLAEALRLDPKYAPAHYDLGMVRFKQGDAEAAIGHFQEALRFAPGFGRAHAALGMTLGSQGKFAEALPHLTQATRLQPTHAPTHHDLALVLTRLGRVQEAIDHFRQAVRLDPEFGEAHASLGQLLAQQGHGKEAIYHLREAIRIDPTDAALRNELGIALADSGELDEAIAQFSEALGIDPNLKAATDNRDIALRLKARKSSDP